MALFRIFNLFFIFAGFSSLAHAENDWCIAVHDQPPCRGARGRCVKNRGGSLGGFVANTASVITADSWRSFFTRNIPTIGLHAQVCDSAAVQGNAVVTDRARIYGRVQIFGTPEGNLEVSGNALIYENAKIWGSAKIRGDTHVHGSAEINGNSELSDQVEVWGNAKISENARLYGNAKVSGAARVFGNARVYEYAKVLGKAWIYGNASIPGLIDAGVVSGEARVFGSAIVEGNVIDNAQVGDQAQVRSQAMVSGRAKILDQAWIDEKAHVTGDSVIRDRARIYGEATITADHGNLLIEALRSVEREPRIRERVTVGGYAQVFGNATLTGQVTVSGSARIYGESRLEAQSEVSDHARITGSARISDRARIGGSAWVNEDAHVFGEAIVAEEAQVFGRAQVHERSRVYGKAKVFGGSHVFGKARIFGDAQVSGDAHITGESRAYDQAQVYGRGYVFGSALVSGNTEVYREFSDPPPAFERSYAGSEVEIFRRHVDQRHQTGNRPQQPIPVLDEQVDARTSGVAGDPSYDPGYEIRNPRLADALSKILRREIRIGTVLRETEVRAEAKSAELIGEASEGDYVYNRFAFPSASSEPFQLASEVQEYLNYLRELIKNKIEDLNQSPNAQRFVIDYHDRDLRITRGLPGNYQMTYYQNPDAPSREGIFIHNNDNPVYRNTGIYFFTMMDGIRENDAIQFVENIIRLATSFHPSRIEARNGLIETFTYLFVAKRFPTKLIRQKYFHYALNCGGIY